MTQEQYQQTIENLCKEFQTTIDLLSIENHDLKREVERLERQVEFYKRQMKEKK